MNEIDCVVVGAGPGGYVAAIRATQLGMRTVVIEREGIVGGRCLHHACIPAKVLLRSADLLSEVRSAGRFGINVSRVEVDFAAICDRRAAVIDGLARNVSALLKKNGVDVIAGEASLEDGGIRVGDRLIEPTRATILATGSVARPLPSVPFGGRVMGTEEAWALSELPASMAVVGAGASGVEIASAFARLGTRVQLFEVAKRILPGEEPEIAQVVHRGLQEQGVEIHLGEAISEVDARGEQVDLRFGATAHRAAWLVLATGRGPDVARLGLASVGITLTADGLIDVDMCQASSRPGIFAIGDIVPGPALAHKASDEGVIAAEAAAGLSPRPLQYRDIPRATFCDPNVGSFGMTEDEANAAGDQIVVGRAPYSAAGGSAVYGTGPGLVKIVARASDGEILGGHVVGARAPELVQEILDVRMSEGGVPELARTTHAHPTISEVVMEAARDAAGWKVHG